ncbi:MAG: choice-of-anchor Q domain-containing protein [Anaerolineae bacterium]
MRLLVASRPWLRALLALVAVALVLTVGQPAHAGSIIYVVPSGTGAGTSWSDGKDLSAALAGAGSGDELWVKAGTYKPDTTNLTDTRTATFGLKTGVAVYGGFTGTETTRDGRNPTTNVTTLSGDLLGNDQAFYQNMDENVYHVVTAPAGLNASAILDGFTIQSGNADGVVTTPLSSGAALPDRGGGMYVDSVSSPTVANVVLKGNAATQAGGGMIVGFNSSPTLTNVKFISNLAGRGGGLYNNGYGSTTLTNGAFIGNTSTYNGGGVYNDQIAGLTLTNVVFRGNLAYTSGGGLYNDTGSAVLTNVSINGNYADTSGGGVYSANNSNLGTYSPTISNSIVWGNTKGEITSVGSFPPIVSYSDVKDGFTGTGNIDINPQFVSPVTPDPNLLPTTAGDLRLGLGSPAIDAGDPNAAIPPLPGTDLDGKSRIVNGRVDMGAYEVPDPTPPVISVTCNGQPCSTGWYTSDVSVAWSVSDPESSIISSSGCSPTTISADTAGTPLTCTATSGGGTNSLQVIIKRDTTPPTISASAKRADNTAYTAGTWTNQTVTAHFTCADTNGSGVATCPPDQVFSSDGVTLSASGTATDNAGNTSLAAAFGPIQIDKTLPTISASAKKADNTTYTAGTWTNQTVTVHFTCADTNGSGVATCPADQVFGSDGVTPSASGTATDNAGNSSLPATFGPIQIDKTPPTVTRNAVADSCSTPGTNGWCRGTQRAGFAASDAGSGLAGPNGCSGASCSFTQSTGANGTAVTISSGQVCDTTGNCAPAIDAGPFKIDSGLPTFNTTISPNPPVLGGAASASPNANDSVSGIFSQSCDAVDTTSVGTRALSCTATDKAGNTATALVSYTVGYRVTYVSPTLGPPSVNNLYPTGMGPWYTIVKWRLTSASGTAVTTGTVAAVRYTGMTCGASTPAYSDSFPSATGFSSTNPKYDSLQSLWVFNWQMPTVKGCYALFAKYSNEQVIPFLFRLY